MGWREEVKVMIDSRLNRKTFLSVDQDTSTVHNEFGLGLKTVSMETALAQLIERVKSLEATLGIQYQYIKSTPAKTVHKRIKK